MPANQDNDASPEQLAAAVGQLLALDPPPELQDEFERLRSLAGDMDFSDDKDGASTRTPRSVHGRHGHDPDLPRGQL
jgi:hypothetical protein